MKAQRIRHLVASGLMFWAASAFPQTFSSGSTATDGDWNPTCTPTPCTVTVPMPPSGVFNYGTVNVPAGVTVLYTKNAGNTPVTILATGDVTINGAINVNGGNGNSQGPSGGSSLAVGVGGPGGFNGGSGAVPGTLPSTPGLGPGGGPGNGAGPENLANASYGAPASFVGLLPLFGGSGGGGAVPLFGTLPGYTGGGGGGAILIASSGVITISGTGAVTANAGVTQCNPFGGGFAGNGSGGAIRLVARQVTSTGVLQAAQLGACNAAPVASFSAGRIRVESILPISLTGTINPPASLSNAPGPVSAAGNPALINLPTISIGTVGSIVPTSPPTGTYSSADATLPVGTTNPVPVTVALTNTPVGAGTAITLKIAPLSQPATTVTIPAGSQTGTFAASSASTNVTFPSGSLTILQAWATFTITSTIAGLLPSIDGEPVERVMVATDDSTVRLVTRSGKEKRLDQLAREDQIRVALAWETMKGAQ